MPLVKAINSIGCFYENMGERGTRYSEEAAEIILDQYRSDEIVYLDPISIVSTYKEYDSLYELCDYLLPGDADQLIMQGLESTGMWSQPNDAGDEKLDMDNMVLLLLANPPVDLEARHPGACAKWLDLVNSSAVGDCYIGDVAMDFVLLDWEGYDLESIMDDPKYGVDSKAMAVFRSSFLNRYNYDIDQLMEEYIAELPSWQHDYSQYRILKNGHILCW